MKDVRQDVRTFARDEGKLGEQAWERLNAHPRTQLIDSLRRIQQDAQEDSVSTDVAFVLCNFDHEYNVNRQVIASAFTKAKGNGLAEERLIDRLIQRGDRHLLSVLFAAAQDSDGALSEALSDTFVRQLRKDPAQFLNELSREPPASRQRIYQIVVGSLSSEDATRVEKAVDSYSRKSEIRKIAGELLEALRMKQG